MVPLSPAEAWGELVSHDLDVTLTRANDIGTVGCFFLITSSFLGVPVAVQDIYS
jgi:hypothetical protein